MTTKVEGTLVDNLLECSVCLQTCIYPVQLPCHHIFCFLCVKGAANRSKRCALCRKEIPVDYFNHPRLVKISKDLQGDEIGEIGQVETYTWFYEGRNGWWQYDKRTNEELEAAYEEDKKSIEILIAGFLYIVDFENMLQMRRNDPTRQRIIKRDLTCAPKKGVAGLKMQNVVKEEQKRSSCDGGDVKTDPTTTLRKSPRERGSDDTSPDPVYASSLGFTTSGRADAESPDYSTIRDPADVLSSHSFHPVSTDTDYINSDFPETNWDNPNTDQDNPSGYTRITSDQDHASHNQITDAPYENLTSDMSALTLDKSHEHPGNPQSVADSKISRNAKRSARLLNDVVGEHCELPTPSVYDTLPMFTGAVYLNDRRVAQPRPTNDIINIEGSSSDITRRHSGRLLARSQGSMRELIPPPLPKRTNSVPIQRKRAENIEQPGLPGRSVRENQRSERSNSISKSSITHV